MKAAEAFGKGNGKKYKEEGEEQTWVQVKCQSDCVNVLKPMKPGILCNWYMSVNIEYMRRSSLLVVSQIN